MGVTRLQFETNVAYWKKIRKSNDQIQYFRVDKDNGLARAKPQTSYAAANTHKIAPEDIQESGHTFEFEQIDQTPGLGNRYTDGVRVGYDIVPSIDFDAIKSGLRPNEFLDLNEVSKFLKKLYRSLHGMREDYNGVYWTMTYQVIREDMTNTSFWNSGMYPPDNNWIYWEEGRGSYAELWENLSKAYATYSNVRILNIGVHFRRGELDL